MDFLLLLAGAWLVFGLVGRAAGGAHGTAAAGGKRVRAELDALYGGEHEYARVTAAAFPEADLDFYDRASAELQALGFRRIADLEDLTISRVYPDRRTFVRVFVDDGGAIRAGIYHLRPRGGAVSVLRWVGMIPSHLHVIELVSEVPTGRFLATSNTKGLDKLSAPPEAAIERLPPETGAVALLTRHRARLTAHCKARPADAPAPQVTFDDVLASVQRQNVVSARHRRALGGLSRDELENLRGRPLNDAEEVFLREVQGADPAGEPAAAKPSDPPMNG